MLLRDFIRKSSLLLQEAYPEDEAKALVLGLCRDVLGTENYTHIVYPDYTVPEAFAPFLEEAVQRLMNFEPLQYITGTAEFSGFSFIVRPGVLIPRPETEELCRMAISSVRSSGFTAGEMPFRILDLCTGSGCIAWTMALSLPGAEVTGVDISETAIETAAGQPLAVQAAERGTRVPDFVRYDVLSGPSGFPSGDYGLILSNPPYVMAHEQSLMRRNVVDYEPGLALFVPDSDPLLFYRAIADFAADRLLPGGRCIVEINEALGEEVCSLFRGYGFADVLKSEDFRARDRFVSFIRSR